MKFRINTHFRRNYDDTQQPRLPNYHSMNIFVCIRIKHEWRYDWHSGAEIRLKCNPESVWEDQLRKLSFLYEHGSGFIGRPRPWLNKNVVQYFVTQKRLFFTLRPGQLVRCLAHIYNHQVGNSMIRSMKSNNIESARVSDPTVVCKLSNSIKHILVNEIQVSNMEKAAISS